MMSLINLKKCFPFPTFDQIIHALTTKDSPSSKRIFNLSTRNQKMLNFVISVTFFSILSLIFILWIFEQESLWSFQRETFRFVDKRIQCLSSAAKTRNDLQIREFWDIQEEKVRKVFEWNTRHLSCLLKLIPVCVHKKKYQGGCETTIHD